MGKGKPRGSRLHTVTALTNRIEIYERYVPWPALIDSLKADLQALFEEQHPPITGGNETPGRGTPGTLAG